MSLARSGDGRAIVDRREREPRLHTVSVEPLALRLKLAHGDLDEVRTLAVEELVGARLQARDARIQRRDTSALRAESLGPFVARRCHFVVAALRLAQLAISSASSLPREELSRAELSRAEFSIKRPVKSCSTACA
jgi:hypothetical protein